MISRGVSPSTGENYKTAVRSFIKFLSQTNPPLSSFSAGTMRQYERWLHENGVSPNTSSCYMRSLRAVYNKAVAKRIVRNHHPFKDVFTGNDHTLKRSIDKSDIRKLQDADLSDCPTLTLSRDLFLFSFYAMGMPFIDLAHLKKSQIRDGVLTYYRHKTGRKVQVRIEECMQDIISRYNCHKAAYVFPILYKVKNGDIVRRTYSTARREYNKKLKSVSRKAELKGNLTSYVARHSWASLAFSNNIDLPVISKALGHANTKTTLIYIKEIDDKRLAYANKKLLEDIIRTPLTKRWGTFVSFRDRDG